MSADLIAALQALHQEHKKVIASDGPIDYQALYKKAIKATEYALKELKKNEQEKELAADIIRSKQKTINRYSETIWNLEGKIPISGYTTEEVMKNIEMAARKGE